MGGNPKDIPATLVGKTWEYVLNWENCLILGYHFRVAQYIARTLAICLSYWMIMHTCLTTRRELGVEPAPRAFGSMKHATVYSSWPHWTPAFKADSGASTGRSCHYGEMQMVLHRRWVGSWWVMLRWQAFVNIFSVENKPLEFMISSQTSWSII